MHYERVPTLPDTSKTVEHYGKKYKCSLCHALIRDKRTFTAHKRSKRHLNAREEEYAQTVGLLRYFNSDLISVLVAEELNVTLYWCTGGYSDGFMMPGWYAVLWSKHGFSGTSKTGRLVRRLREECTDDRMPHLMKDESFAQLAEAVKRALKDERKRSALTTQFGLLSPDYKTKLPQGKKR